MSDSGVTPTAGAISALPDSSSGSTVTVAAPPAETVAHQDLAARLTELESAMQGGMTRVLAALDALASDGDFKARQLERLRAELDEYRGDFLRKLTVPLLLGIVKLHDDVSRRADVVNTATPDEVPREKLAKWFGEVAEDIELMLRHHGIESYRCPSEHFERERQTAVTVRPARQAAEVGTIARRLRPGFMRGEEILQKERVEVFGPDVSGEKR